MPGPALPSDRLRVISVRVKRPCKPAPLFDSSTLSLISPSSNAAMIAAPPEFPASVLPLINGERVPLRPTTAAGSKTAKPVACTPPLTIVLSVTWSPG